MSEQQQPYIRHLSFRICINKGKEKKTTTQLKRNKSGPSLVKTKRKKKWWKKKQENKSHYNFDNLNVVNLNEENTKKGKIDQE